MASSNKNTIEIDQSKKKLFWIITLLIPLLLIVVTELILRGFNYGGNLEVFIDGPEKYENYLRVNPNIGKRYFFNESSVPTPLNQIFKKEKAQNTYRIFVLGGSTAAGFPYSNNVSFPNILQNSLRQTYKDKDIEIINLAMSAVNSYTILDLMPEVLEQSPDLILVYAGHNEYYGALGVGSQQSIGNSREVIKLYLKIQSSKLFLLVRDFIGWCYKLLSSNNVDLKDKSNTLMSRIVAEQTIPFNSKLYEDGLTQFSLNLEEVISLAREENVDIILSEVVSNLKDQPPFISVDVSGSSAKNEYQYGMKFLSEGKTDSALSKFKLAKDFDALRFRAPEEINSIINRLGNKYNLPIVKMEAKFSLNSEQGVIDNSLMLEHLHPNINGYNLMANSFYENIIQNNYIGKVKVKNLAVLNSFKQYTKLDSVYGALVIKRLKQSWPFKPKNFRNDFLSKYSPTDHFEKLVLKVLKTENYNLETAHLELARHYSKNNLRNEAINEYQALIASVPSEFLFYNELAEIYLMDRNFKKANDILASSLKYGENLYAFKWIGQIALRNKNYNKAIKYLSKSDANDSQVVFNIARAYYNIGDTKNGDKYKEILKPLKGSQKYLKYLR